MIVIVGNGAELSPAEEMVRRSLESWGTGDTRVGGVAVMSCNVRRRRGRGSHALDALVWTPYRCTVVEVKGFRSVQHGVVDPRLNGAWRIGDAVADLYELQSAANPVAQATPYMYAVKNRLEFAGLPYWVELLVVLVHQEHARVEIASTHLDRGIFLASASPGRDRLLREHFTTTPGSKQHWSGEDIERAFRALELDDYLPARHELAAEGFCFERSQTVSTVELDDDPFAPVPTPAASPITGIPLPSAPLSRDTPAPAAPANVAPGIAEPEPTRPGRWAVEDRDEDRWVSRHPAGIVSPSTPPLTIAFAPADDTDHSRRRRFPVSDRYRLYPAVSPPPFPGPTRRAWPQWLDVETLVSVLAIGVLAALLLVAVSRCGGEDTPTHTGEDLLITRTGQAPPVPAPPPAPPAHTPNNCMPFETNC